MKIMKQDEINNVSGGIQELVQMLNSRELSNIIPDTLPNGIQREPNSDGKRYYFASACQCGACE